MSRLKKQQIFIMDTSYAPFVKAILYGDIFDFPLTREELWAFAIGEKAIRQASYDSFVRQLPRAIKQTGGYFHIAGKEALVLRRRERLSVSKRKYVLARRAASLLAKIPTIRFVGVSGGLSMMNADENDDIDFFIITEHNAVWVTRLLVFLILSTKGIGRKRNDTQVKDAICVNMYLDEHTVALPKSRHDLYTAHEVAQIVPLVDNAYTYKKFITANAWILEFLPNTGKRQAVVSKLQSREKSRFETALHALLHVSVPELLAKYVQLLYMKRHRTRESISDTIVAFHPIDYRGNTLKAYEERIRAYEKIYTSRNRRHIR